MTKNTKEDTYDDIINKIKKAEDKVTEYKNMKKIMDNKKYIILDKQKLEDTINNAISILLDMKKYKPALTFITKHNVKLDIKNGNHQLTEFKKELLKLNNKLIVLKKKQSKILPESNRKEKVLKKKQKELTISNLEYRTDAYMNEKYTKYIKDMESTIYLTKSKIGRRKNELLNIQNILKALKKEREFAKEDNHKHIIENTTKKIKKEMSNFEIVRKELKEQSNKLKDTETKLVSYQSEQKYKNHDSKFKIDTEKINKKRKSFDKYNMEWLNELKIVVELQDNITKISYNIEDKNKWIKIFKKRLTNNNTELKKLPSLQGKKIIMIEGYNTTTHIPSPGNIKEFMQDLDDDYTKAIKEANRISSKLETLMPKKESEIFINKLKRKIQKI